MRVSGYVERRLRDGERGEGEREKETKEEGGMEGRDL